MWSGKKVLILIFIAVMAFISAAVFFVNKSELVQNSDKVTEKTEIPREAWLEIIKPSVSEVGKNKEKIKEFANGDTVVSGMILSVSPEGQAIVHFPDGSLMRVDAGTIFKIDESYFKPESETLSVKVTLIGGRIWSKVVALISPASVWQVKTSSAVATVRGTSFGTEYVEGKTVFLGSQNKVKIAAVDPKTGEAKKGTEAELSPDTAIEIKDTDIPKITAAPAPLAVSVAPKTIIGEKWIKENQSADTVVDKMVSEIRLEEKNDQNAREKLRELNQIRRKELKEEIEKSKKDIKKPAEERIEKTFEQSANRLIEIRNEKKTGENSDGINKEAVPDAKTDASLKTTTDTIAAPSPVPVKTTAKPIKIYIKGMPDNTDIMEGSSIPLRVILVLSDGTERDVSSTAKWGMRGKIGSVNLRGIFVAAFDKAESEFESVSGEITASLSIDGAVFLAPPVSVKVIHFEDDTIPIG